jgi:hypothetical protein
MSESLTSDNLRKVFTFPFQDPKWLEKFLIGSLLLLVSFLVLPIFLIYGYFAGLMQMAIEGNELSLPEWDSWEKKFTDGIKLFFVGLIYTLPFPLFFIVGYMVLFGSAIASDMVEIGGDPSSPFWLIPSLLSSFGSIAIFGLGLILVLIAGLFMPAMIAHVIATDDVSAAFRISEWWGIFKANLSGFVISYLIVLGLFTALNFVSQFLYMTVVLCCILPFIFIPATLYIMVTTSVLFGQAYREGVQNLQS